MGSVWAGAEDAFAASQKLGERIYADAQAKAQPGAGPEGADGGKDAGRGREDNEDTLVEDEEHPAAGGASAAVPVNTTRFLFVVAPLSFSYDILARRRRQRGFCRHATNSGKRSSSCWRSLARRRKTT